MMSCPGCDVTGPLPWRRARPLPVCVRSGGRSAFPSCPARGRGRPPCCGAAGPTGADGGRRSWAGPGRAGWWRHRHRSRYGRGSARGTVRSMAWHDTARRGGLRQAWAPHCPSGARACGPGQAGPGRAGGALPPLVLFSLPLFLGRRSPSSPASPSSPVAVSFQAWQDGPRRAEPRHGAAGEPQRSRV